MTEFHLTKYFIPHHYINSNTPGNRKLRNLCNTWVQYNKNVSMSIVANLLCVQSIPLKISKKILHKTKRILELNYD